MGVLPDWMLEASKCIKPFEPAQKRPGTISYGVSSYGYDARIGYKFKVFTPVHCGEVDPKAFDEKAFVEVDLTPRGGHAFSRYVTNVDTCKYCGVAFDNPYKDSYLAECVTKGIPNFIRIPPNSFALGETIEEFDIPRDCLAIVLGKSTYARCGIIVNVTPLEPEWRGKVTVEISNTTPLPARIYAGEGIMQVLFLRSDGHRAKLQRVVDSLIDLAAVRSFDEEQNVSCKTSYADKGGKYQDQAGLVLPKVD